LVLALHFATTRIGYSRPAVSPNEACKHPVFSQMNDMTGSNAIRRYYLSVKRSSNMREHTRELEF
jgi:hypothetical protein